MSAAQDCSCACPDPTVTLVPGSPGSDGAAGQSAFSVTSSAGEFPAVGDTTILEFENNEWMVVGLVIMSGVGAYFQVVTIGATSVVVRYLDIPQNTTAPFTVIPAGTKFVPTGPPVDLAPILQVADDSGGTVADIVETGVGISHLVFYIDAAALANGDVLTNYVPGYKFAIVKFDARCASPVTTGGKAATLNLEIVSTDVTGGVISLSGTYAQGATQAGTAVSGNNLGSSSSALSIEASGVTAFIEGGFWLIISIKNMDVADAFATTLDRLNDIISQIT